MRTLKMGNQYNVLLDVYRNRIVNTLTSFCAEKLGSYVLNTPLKIVAELLALLQHIVYKL